MQEAADAWVGVRSGVLETVAKPEDHAVKEDGGTKSKRGAKRKREDLNADPSQPVSRAPRTRSQRKAASASQHSGASTPSAMDGAHGDATIADSDDAADGEYNPDESPRPPLQAAQHTPAKQTADGLVACPICNKRMREEFVFPHTDTCTGIRSPSPAPTKFCPRQNPQPSKETPTPPPERLPQLNYSLLKDTALKKKLADLRIPNWGPRGLLIRRHGEWTALWNANCDARLPRGRKELLADLDRWERSQGGLAPAGGGFVGAGVMAKGFDGVEWGRRNGDEFRELVARARGGRKAGQSRDGGGDRVEVRPEGDAHADSCNSASDRNPQNADGTLHHKDASTPETDHHGPDIRHRPASQTPTHPSAAPIPPVDHLENSCSSQTPSGAIAPARASSTAEKDNVEVNPMPEVPEDPILESNAAGEV